ncbi:MAG: hypothetical protein ACOZF0_15415 [Thermodesulfobacteriota bacterium]
MKIIAFSETADAPFFGILKTFERADKCQVLRFCTAKDFKEAVRTNIAPKPVILFSAVERSQFRHLQDIRDYLFDSILLLIVPNEEHYQSFQKESAIYPRYVFYKEDEQQLLPSVLTKLGEKIAISQIEQSSCIPEKKRWSFDTKKNSDDSEIIRDTQA